MMPLFETWLKVLAFFLPLVLRKDFVGILVVLGFSIGVCHTNVDNTKLRLLVYKLKFVVVVLVFLGGAKNTLQAIFWTE
jgi:hypothetical protein